MSLVFTGLIIFGCIYFYLALGLPNVDQLKDNHMQVPLRVYTKDGKLIGEFGEKKRIPVTVDQVPPLLIQAILDTEDQRFYEHRGVDFWGLVRAVVVAVESGHASQGASTITMQVARNFFLTPEKTYTRKINEILLAFKIDRTFSKKEILELYLNKIYLGQRAYGVASAAQVYFGKRLNQLALSQMAMIAGLPQAPSRDNPLTNPESALDRRNHVLDRMLENKHITVEQYKEAQSAPLGINYHVQQAEIEAPYLSEMVRNAMVAQFGDAAYDEGYKVYTTIDSHMQTIANQALRNGLIAYEDRHGYRGPEAHFDVKDLDQYAEKLRGFAVFGDLFPAAITNVNPQSIIAVLDDGSHISIVGSGFSWASRGKAGVWRVGDVVRVRKMADGKWRLEQLPKVEGALIALDVKNGAVLSLVGGFSYSLSNFNRAVQAGRQAGSGFKPFIYSAALAKGYTLATVINDAPVAWAIPGTNMVWRPQNDNQRFYGPTRLRVGLIQSRNLVSVRLLQMIGVSYAADYVMRFGFNTDEVPAMPSIALGATAISPLKLAAGYAAFANGGYKTIPYFIESIEDRDGKILFKATPKVIPEENKMDKVQSGQQSDQGVAQATRIITPQNAYLITSALKDVIYAGTARKASILKRSDLAGKTGTTNDQVDAWFNGYNGDLVTTVWVGYDKPKSLYEHGAQAALPIWMEFMGTILSGKPEHSVAEPDGITSARIDPDTGLLAYSGQADAVFEIFTDDTVPTREASESDQGISDETSSENQPNNDSAGNPLF